MSPSSMRRDELVTMPPRVCRSDSWQKVRGAPRPPGYGSAPSRRRSRDLVDAARG
eukprot:CAMPEP_0176291312 /NCGR_PEP_ID=MMETSP0121_2-20121125/55480_1 /TAXON_ID=160619 /ORGANISM="Kryptoperidinium foliaceum, Strain CCMP 1326" /LENGTH=54 /DNA_ID=CAMNT_0017632143 /DNA_START=32 /DNA_END=196 /DNA_ORIENTATION=+